ncbi:DUF6251 family protein [Streptomyces sp. NPDC047315]|uniref:DUF6251 family protein n=1 Tax=Streptomyces sp. NPDC047315 TaxID=3155142 RepID=UPI0033D1D58F
MIPDPDPQYAPAPSSAVVVRMQDGTYAYLPQPQGGLPAVHSGAGTAPVPQVVHIHQAAPPDRTLQRVALGGGIGAGAVGASVYLGPMLVAAINSIAISLATGALVVVCVTYGLVAVVRSIGGPDGAGAVDNIRKARGR